MFGSARLGLLLLLLLHAACSVETSDVEHAVEMRWLQVWHVDRGIVAQVPVAGDNATGTAHTFELDGTSYRMGGPLANGDCTAGFGIGNYDAEWFGDHRSELDILHWTSQGAEIVVDDIGKDANYSWSSARGHLCVVAFETAGDVSGKVYVLTLSQDGYRDVAIVDGATWCSIYGDGVIYGRMTGGVSEIRIEDGSIRNLAVDSQAELVLLTAGGVWLDVGDPERPAERRRSFHRRTADSDDWEVGTTSETGFTGWVSRSASGHYALGDLDESGTSGRPYFLTEDAPPQRLADVRVNTFVPVSEQLMLFDQCATVDGLSSEGCRVRLLARDGSGSETYLGLDRCQFADRDGNFVALRDETLGLVIVDTSTPSVAVSRYPDFQAWFAERAEGIVPGGPPPILLMTDFGVLYLLETPGRYGQLEASAGWLLRRRVGFGYSAAGRVRQIRNFEYHFGWQFRIRDVTDLATPVTVSESVDPATWPYVVESDGMAQCAVFFSRP